MINPVGLIKFVCCWTFIFMAVVMLIRGHPSAGVLALLAIALATAPAMV